MSIHYPAILTELPGDTGLLLPENNPVGSLEEGGFPVTFPWGSLKWTKLNLCLESQMSWDGARWTRLLPGPLPGPPPLPSPASLRIIVPRASQPARQGQQSLQVQRPERLQEVCLCTKHPLPTCPLSRFSTSPGGSVLCCDWSNLGRVPLATPTQHHQVCKFSALYLLRREGAGRLGTFSSVYQKDKKQH